MVKTAAMLLSCNSLNSASTTSFKPYGDNGSVTKGMRFSILLYPSSRLNTSFTHKKDEIASWITTPSPFICRRSPKNQMSLLGCLPMQVAALYVSLIPSIRHLLYK